MIHFRRGEAIKEDVMICPNCKRDAKTETTTGVLKYRNRYGNDVPGIEDASERILRVDEDAAIAAGGGIRSPATRLAILRWSPRTGSNRIFP
jgi:hypothetical protein